MTHVLDDELSDPKGERSINTTKKYICRNLVQMY